VTNEQTTRNAVIACGVLIVIMTILYFIYTAPVRKTNRICTDAVNAYAASNTAPDNVVDAWGNKVEFSAQISATQIIYTAKSAGRDQKFGTDDDIVATKIDYNGARIAGEWLGSRAKEFTKGVASGVTKPTKFDNTQPESSTKP